MPFRFSPSKLAGLSVIMFSILVPSSAFAASSVVGSQGDFGLGVILGAPTGLSAKYWLSGKTAIDGALAWHFGENDRFQIHGNHLWHWELKDLRTTEGRLPLYAGIGLRVIAGSDTDAGIRIPLGASYLFERAPLEAFIELVPVLDVIPSTDADLDGAIGIRYYFK